MFLQNLKELIACMFFLYAQMLYAGDGMEIRRYNFTTFHADEKNITAELLKKTPAEFQHHPEFGILPYKAGCNNCVELLQKRSLNSRYFIDPENSSHFYVQQSYFPLHYADQSGVFRTIDLRLRPDTYNPRIFTAPHQPVPTMYDSQQHKTFILTSGLIFGFNNNLSIYYLDNSGRKQNFSAVNFSNTKVGESGVMTTEAWKDIDIRQVFEQGSVETDFIINQPLAIPQGMAWLVFEDEISLPNAYELVKGENGRMDNDRYWSGDLTVEGNGKQLIDFHKPKYFDSNNLRIAGVYDLEKTATSFKVKVLVPVDFLTNPVLTYPIYVDPLVSGRDSMGNFISAMQPSGANLAFTRVPQSCDYILNVTVPASELQDVLIDVEYKTSDSLCATVTGAHPSPFCNYSDVAMEVVGPCLTTGQLVCAPSNPPFSGVCTTDPDKVAGTSALRFSGFLNCVPNQCTDYQIPFTLKNRTYQCPESCGFSCAIGSFFAVTVEGRTNDTTLSRTICQGDSIFIGGAWQKNPGIYSSTFTAANGCDSIVRTYLSVADSFAVNFIAGICQGDSFFIGGAWHTSPGIFRDVLQSSGGCDSIVTTYLTVTDHVWPGDANNDLIANNSDLLPIGLYFGETGFARDSISNQWLGQCALDWGTSQSNGSNKKHVDCNGDGKINQDDNDAINRNYGLTHSKSEGYPAPASGPILTLVPGMGTYDPGDTVILDIVLGDASLPVSDLYGIAFNLTFDKNLIEPGTASLYYVDSWLGNISGNLTISKIFETTGRADGAVVRTDHQNVSGYGAIGVLEFIAKTNINIQQTTIGFTDYQAVDADGNSKLFNVQLLSTAVGELSSELSSFRIYPNPFTSSTTIEFSLKQDSEVSLKIYDVLGRVIYDLPVSQKTKGIHQFQFENQTSGKGLFIAELNLDGIKIRKRLAQIE